MSGRCAGCGTTSKSAAEVREHIRYCPDYRKLFARDPAAALDPEAEHARWVQSDRAAERADRRQAAVAEADRRREEQHGLLAAADDGEIDADEAMAAALRLFDQDDGQVSVPTRGDPELPAGMPSLPEEAG